MHHFSQTTASIFVKNALKTTYQQMFHIFDNVFVIFLIPNSHNKLCALAQVFEEHALTGTNKDMK